MDSASPEHLAIDRSLASGDTDGTLSISWTHRLRMTQHVLHEDNSVITSLLPPLPHLRVLIVLDGGLQIARPDLLPAIRAWGERHRDRLTLVEEPVVLTGGEQSKAGWAAFEATAEAIARQGICRRSLIMIFGGGAVLDAAGFAAATAHRGVPIMRFPTTTLAQADAGIGVKNAINRFGMKNFLGTFSPPLAVINDIQFLDSLDTVHWRGGLSEAVKVAALKSGDLLALIEQHCDDLRTPGAAGLAAITPIMVASAKLHMDHIVSGGDPFELSDARPLDFGHWAAHRLEAISDWKLPHGDAVAIGLKIDLLYATRIGRLSTDVARRIIRCLSNLGFPESCPGLEDPANLLRGIEEFREHLGGRLAIPIITDLEQAEEVREIDFAAMQWAIDEVRRGCPSGR